MGGGFDEFGRAVVAVEEIEEVGKFTFDSGHVFDGCILLVLTGFIFDELDFGDALDGAFTVAVTGEVSIAHGVGWYRLVPVGIRIVDITIEESR